MYIYLSRKSNVRLVKLHHKNMKQTFITCNWLKQTKMHKYTIQITTYSSYHTQCGLKSYQPLFAQLTVIIVSWSSLILMSDRRRCQRCHRVTSVVVGWRYYWQMPATGQSSYWIPPLSTHINTTWTHFSTSGINVYLMVYRQLNDTKYNRLS